jgi:hypothetical protein
MIHKPDSKYLMILKGVEMSYKKEKLIEKLKDLKNQADTERSHFYTASLLQETIEYLETLKEEAMEGIHRDLVLMAVARNKAIDDCTLAMAGKEVSVGDKYNELIMAVGNKYKGETRHQTALRYIKMAEESQDKAQKDNGGGE